MPRTREYKLTHTSTGDKIHVHQFHIFCPGCKYIHAMNPMVHQFNGSMDLPTFHPSLLVAGSAGRCHSFVRDGKIQFLTDCSHALAGKTVDLPDTSTWEEEL